jgi:hypothetical protein
MAIRLWRRNTTSIFEGKVGIYEDRQDIYNASSWRSLVDNYLKSPSLPLYSFGVPGLLAMCSMKKCDQPIEIVGPKGVKKYPEELTIQQH